MGRKRISPIGGYTCPYCPLRYLRVEHIERHIRKHTGEKPFLCTIAGCSRRFSRKDNMMQHVRTHKKDGKVVNEEAPSVSNFETPLEIRRKRMKKITEEKEESLRKGLNFNLNHDRQEPFFKLGEVKVCYSQSFPSESENGRLNESESDADADADADFEKNENSEDDLMEDSLKSRNYSQPAPSFSHLIYATNLTEGLLDHSVAFKAVAQAKEKKSKLPEKNSENQKEVNFFPPPLLNVTSCSAFSPVVPKTRQSEPNQMNKPRDNRNEVSTDQNQLVSVTNSHKTTLKTDLDAKPQPVYQESKRNYLTCSRPLPSLGEWFPIKDFLQT